LFSVVVCGLVLDAGDEIHDPGLSLLLIHIDPVRQRRQRHLDDTLVV